MGVVLHVFEDSMVNYLFFIIYGIVQGSLSHLLPKTLPFFFPTKRSLFSKYNSKEKA
ncbi:MAG: hypothetical protein LBP53_03910 [Candidatus Peribacteria bacterium]|nr:hypothetical protein [Candidatus Peribacteria bacterium]